MRYFLDHAQHSSPVQTVTAFINIKLPFQKPDLLLPSSSSGSGNPSSSSSPPRTTSPLASQLQTQQDPAIALLIPYIRRLVATAFDSPAVLHGFFGDDWSEGIGPIHEAERRNYLFAAKSDSWLAVKRDYDMGDGQTVPFLRPLQNVSLAEIEAAENGWSEWLAMQDWMLGPRAPTPDVVDGVASSSAGRIKTERP